MGSFRDLLVRALQARGDPAVVEPGRTLSGRELLSRAGGLAEWLDDIGVTHRQIVPSLLHANGEALALACAGAMAGRPIAPLNPRAPASELAATVRSLGATVLLSQPETEERARQTAALVPRLCVRSPPREVYASTSLRDADPSDVGLAMFTSGTTAAPRCIPMDDATLAARAQAYARVVDLRPGDRLASAAAFHHISGLGTHLIALAVGATVVLLPRFDPDAWRHARDAGPTHVVLVPTMIDALLVSGDLDIGQRVLVYGAAPVHPDTLRELARSARGIRMLQLFGQTEGSPLAALGHEDHLAALDGRPELLRSVGRPLPEVSLRIENPGPDGIGEIVVRAAHLGLTDADGWLRTGDLGDVRDGYVYLSGRRSNRIIRGGENIYPLVIERVLASHPLVAEAAVISQPDRRLGEVPWACLVSRGAKPPLDELEALVRDQLSAFNVPAGWTFLEELPRNAAGKVLRRMIAVEQPGVDQA